jgi:peptide deformylase
MAEHEHPHDADLIEADDGTTEEPPPLDPEVAARREAALAQVVQFGDPVLKSKALPITTFDDALKAEIERMGTLMADSLGIGLAATQVGRLRRLLVYRVEADGPIQALINPELEWSSKEEEVFEEGCLSLRGVVVDVERPIHVRVAALDAEGEPVVVEASGLEARVIQHEMDHLDGVLIIDRAPRDQRREAMRILRERDEAVA